jgi:hypothetical protein
MQAVLIDVLKIVAMRLGVISDYSETIPAGTKQVLIDLVNEVKDDIAEAVTLPALTTDELPPILTQGIYTTGTVSIDNGDTSAVVSGGALTDSMVGRKVVIGSDYSIYIIKSVNTGAGTFIIDRAFYGADETAGTFTIFQDIYQVPSNIRKILALTDLQNSDRQIVQLPARTLLALYPDPTRDYGDVVTWSDLGQGRNTETVTASVASASSVTSTGLAGTYDDYYKDWLLKDDTLNTVVRVTGFVQSTGVLTLEVPITGIATTDTLTLVQPFQKILIRNTPSNFISLRVVGYKQFTPLINDTDVENEIPQAYAKTALVMGLMYFYKVNRQETSGENLAVLAQQYQAIKGQIGLEVNKMPTRTYRWGQLTGVMEMNRRMGPGWPVDYS